MRPSLRGRSGLALMEVVVASAVLGILVMGWMTFEANSQREIQQSVTRSKVQKVLLIIQSDILRDDRFMPARDVIPEIDNVVPTTEAIEASFTEAAEKYVGHRCYDDGGVDVPCADPRKYFETSFYKIRVRDRGYPAESDLSRLPLSRINIRVKYRERGHADNEGPQEKIRYFSRLVTATAAY